MDNDNHQVDLAIMNSDILALNKFIKSGEIDVDGFDDISCTPLIYAARNNNIEVMKLLLSAGANINAYEEQKIGNTVLRDVAETASFPIIEFLLKSGANPDIKGWMGLSSVDMVEKRYKKNSSSENEKIMQLLKAKSRIKKG